MNNFAQFSAQVDDWLAGTRELAKDVARGLSVKLFYGVLSRSPQFSGDYAANWQYSTGLPNSTFRGGLFPDQKVRIGEYGRISGPTSAKSTGHPEAIAYAISNNAGRDAAAKLGVPIFISNSAQHDDAYAWLIENNQIKFRPGNAGAVARLSAAEVIGRYAHIGKAEAIALSAARIGA